MKNFALRSAGERREIFSATATAMAITPAAAGKNFSLAPAIKLLNEFIESELEKLEQLSVVENESDRDIEDLNVLFAKLVG